MTWSPEVVVGKKTDTLPVKAKQVFGSQAETGESSSEPLPEHDLSPKRISGQRGEDQPAGNACVNVEVSILWMLINDVFRLINSRPSAL